MNDQAAPKRITDALMDYWYEKKDGKAFPPESTIDPDELADYWDDCFLAQILNQGDDPDFRYDYLGKRLTRVFNYDEHMGDMAELVKTDAPKVHEKFLEVYQTKAPIRVDLETATVHNMDVKYRQLILPFGDADSGVITHIFGGLRWILE